MQQSATDGIAIEDSTMDQNKGGFWHCGDCRVSGCYSIASSQKSRRHSLPSFPNSFFLPKRKEEGVLPAAKPLLPAGNERVRSEKSGREPQNNPEYFSRRAFENR